VYNIMQKSKASGMLYRFDPNVLTTILKERSTAILIFKLSVKRGGSSLLRDAAKNLTFDTASHPRRIAYSSKLF